MVRMRVFTVRRQQGVGRASGRAYNFQTVGGLLNTGNGEEYVEVMLDGDAPEPKRGEVYDVEMSWHPDREKRLQFRVEALRPVGPVAKQAA